MKLNHPLTQKLSLHNLMLIVLLKDTVLMFMDHLEHFGY